MKIQVKVKPSSRTEEISREGNNFIVKDSSGTVVGYISGTAGVMYFKGVLHYNSDF